MQGSRLEWSDTLCTTPEMTLSTVVVRRHVMWSVVDKQTRYVLASASDKI